jgi:hypothetical protein
MTEDTVSAPSSDSLEADIVPSGGGFRAVLRRGDEIVWRCPHVHFTDHSAKACAARQLATATRGA